jgi:hypothetical protein
MKSLIAILLSWWFLFYLSPDGRWTRWGPIGRPACEQTAANLKSQGIEARCVEFWF